ncbi:MAG: WG repeat-containing protein [Elusimicrobiota bacterium]
MEKISDVKLVEKLVEGGNSILEQIRQIIVCQQDMMDISLSKMFFFFCISFVINIFIRTNIWGLAICPDPGTKHFYQSDNGMYELEVEVMKYKWTEQMWVTGPPVKITFRKKTETIWKKELKEFPDYVCISNNGKYVVLNYAGWFDEGGSGGFLIFDSSGTLVKNVENYGEKVNKMLWIDDTHISGNGRYFAILDYSGKVYFYSVNDGKLLWKKKMIDEISPIENKIIISEDGQYLLVSINCDNDDKTKIFYMDFMGKIIWEKEIDKLSKEIYEYDSYYTKYNNWLYKEKIRFLEDSREFSMYSIKENAILFYKNDNNKIKFVKKHYLVNLSLECPSIVEKGQKYQITAKIIPKDLNDINDINVNILQYTEYYENNKSKRYTVLESTKSIKKLKNGKSTTLNWVTDNTSPEGKSIISCILMAGDTDMCFNQKKISIKEADSSNLTISGGSYIKIDAKIQKNNKYNIRYWQNKIVLILFKKKNILIPFQIGEKWGFIDKNKRVVTPLKYDFIGDTSEGLTEVVVFSEKGDKCGYINAEGQEVVPLKYDNELSVVSNDFKEGLAKVKLNNKYGFIDKNGKEIIPIKYDDTWGFSDGLAAVEMNKKWGFVDKNNNIIIPFKYDGTYLGFKEGLASVELNGKWGYIDKNGKEITPFKYKEAGEFRDGLAFVSICSLDKKNFKYGFVNKQGKEITPLQYDAFGYQGEGLISVEIKGKWGFIDLKNGYKFIFYR